MQDFQNVLSDLKENNQTKTITLKQEGKGVWKVKDNSPSEMSYISFPVPIIRKIKQGTAAGPTVQNIQHTEQIQVDDASKLKFEQEASYADYLVRRKESEIKKERLKRTGGRAIKTLGLAGAGIAGTLGGEGVQNLMAKGAAAGLFAMQLKEFITGGEDEKSLRSDEQDQLQELKNNRNKILAERVKGQIESSPLMNGGAAMAAMGPEKSDVTQIIAEMELANKLKAEELDFLRDQRPEKVYAERDRGVFSYGALRKTGQDGPSASDKSGNTLDGIKEIATAGVGGYLFSKFGKLGKLLKGGTKALLAGLLGAGRTILPKALPLLARSLPMLGPIGAAVGTGYAATQVGSKINETIGSGALSNALGRTNEDSTEETVKEKLFRKLLSDAARNKANVVSTALKSYDQGLLTEDQYRQIVEIASKAKKRKKNKQAISNSNELIGITRIPITLSDENIRPLEKAGGSSTTVAPITPKGPQAMGVAESLTGKKSSANQILDKIDTSSGIGFVSAKYESRGDVGTISSGRGDPGGVSYGKHQLASKTGTLQRYLKQSKYGAHFAGLTPATPAFNAKWKELAATDPNFGKDQENFITKTHFAPAAAKAEKLGFDINNVGVREAIYSGSVQHGGINKILTKAAQSLGPNATPEQQIEAFYNARSQYVSNLGSMSGQMKQNIIGNRYAQERLTTLALASGGQTGVGTMNALVSAGSSTPSAASALDSSMIINADLSTRRNFGYGSNSGVAPTIINTAGGGGGRSPIAPPTAGNVQPRPSESTFFDLQRKALLSTGI